jgi:FkbM family methyltransferase
MSEPGQKISGPVKTVRIGAQIFDIEGVSSSDPYFLAIVEAFEPEFERLCDDLVRYDYVCADIGANIGMKSLLLAQYAPHGRILAIEAGPTVAAVLARNVAGGGCLNNIAVICTAIGDRDGTARFNEQSAYGHISGDGIEVPIRKLASIVAELDLKRLDFVKIDVEGYEFPILRNSIDLLNHHRALVLLEFNSWTQIAFADINPKEFAEWIFNHFSYVFRVRRGAGADYLERLSDRGPMDFLHTNLVHDGVVSDLLVTNFEGRLASVPNFARRAVTIERDAALAERDAAAVERNVAAAERDAAAAERGVAVAERDAAVAERDAAAADRDAAAAERDAAVAERNALLQSRSWRITKPLRALRSVASGSVEDENHHGASKRGGA